MDDDSSSGSSDDDIPLSHLAPTAKNPPIVGRKQNQNRHARSDAPTGKGYKRQAKQSNAAKKKEAKSKSRSMFSVK